MLTKAVVLTYARVELPSLASLIANAISTGPRTSLIVKVRLSTLISNGICHHHLFHDFLRSPRYPMTAIPHSNTRQILNSLYFICTYVFVSYCLLFVFTIAIQGCMYFTLSI